MKYFFRISGFLIYPSHLWYCTWTMTRRYVYASTQMRAVRGVRVNPFRWKIRVDIVSGQQCRVETKDRNRLSVERWATCTEQSSTGVRELLAKRCYRLRGIKDNSLCRELPPTSTIVRSTGCSPVYEQVQGGWRATNVPRYFSKSWNYRKSSVRVKTNAIQCIQVVWESVLLETNSELLLNELDKNWIHFYSPNDQNNKGNNRGKWNFTSE